MTPPERDESSFVGHEPCPKCGSRNNLARYASGRGHCHGCGHNEFPENAGDYQPSTSRSKRPMNQAYTPLAGDYGDETFTKAYGISTSTRKDLGIRLVTYGIKHLDVEYPAKPCVTFDYRLPDGTLWGQKVRYKLPEDCEDGGKTFRFPHASGPQKAPLWLMNKWTQGTDRRSLCVFEGEGDAAAYFQITGGKFPVVSLPNGAKGAEESIKEWYEWLDGFDKIVLIFDADPTGREWSKRVAALLPPGKAYVGEVPGHKDAREALLAGDTKSIQQAYFNAEEFKPEGIFSVSDLKAQAIMPVAIGTPWFLDTLTKWTYGRRVGELIVIGAGNSVGKTDFCTQAIEFDAMTLGMMTAVIYLEQHPVETVKRVAGKSAGKQFHIPAEDGKYTEQELSAAIDALEASGKLLFGGNFASTSWEDLKGRIRYLAVSKGVKSFWIDNLTALIDPNNERASVETIVKEMALLAQELQVLMVLVCHLATPEGKSHEEGGRVSLKHFKGSRAIGAFAHYAFGLERATTHDDPAMRTYMTVRCVKDRFTGKAGGNTMCLRYDQTTGLLQESEFPAEDSTGQSSVGFSNYSTDGDSPLNI